MRTESDEGVTVSQKSHGDDDVAPHTYEAVKGAAMTLETPRAAHKNKEDTALCSHDLRCVQTLLLARTSALRHSSSICDRLGYR